MLALWCVATNTIITTTTRGLCDSDYHWLLFFNNYSFDLLSSLLLFTKNMDLKVVLVVVFVFLMYPVNGLWWALGSPVVMDPTRICRKARRLRSRQIEICRREPKLVAEVLRGAQLGTKECQFQFRNRRWNCSTDRKSVRKLLLRGNKYLSV
ncbi:Proto-oncoprotein Wnt-3 [Chamberlinius hualienensis]